MARRIPPPDAVELPERELCGRVVRVAGEYVRLLPDFRALAHVAAVDDVRVAFEGLRDAIQRLEDHCKYEEQRHEGVISIDTARAHLRTKEGK